MTDDVEDESLEGPIGAEGPDWLREIDHTGDVGISVSAPALEALFARAAWGLFAVLTDMAAVRPEEEQEVVVEGADRDDLMGPCPARWVVAIPS